MMSLALLPLHPILPVWPYDSEFANNITLREIKQLMADTKRACVVDRNWLDHT
jgi:hypothetical protein